MNVKNLYKLYQENPFICTDSRKIVKDSIFFALKGDSFNGNKFANKALAEGCSYTVIDEKEFAGDSRIILVDSVLETLQNLAEYHRTQFNIPIIAITGTNGKTTTKELIYSVLSKKYNTHATVGNLNNHIGVPLTLLSMTKQTEIAVVEMGANHGGEIAELCRICKPDFGLITNIGKAHLEGFGSFEGVIAAKKELYDFLTNKGSLFVNASNSLLTNILDGFSSKDLIFYNSANNACCYAVQIASDPFLNFELHLINYLINRAAGIKLELSNYKITTQLVGKYNLENVLAAVCIGLYFEVPMNLIIEAIENYRPQNNRSQMVKTGTNTILMDAYNANPTSMEVAINNFADIDAPKKVVILGDMLELGDVSDIEHERLINAVSSNNFDTVILIGKHFVKALKKNQISNCFVFDNVDLFIDKFKDRKLTSSHILIKGSRGIKLEKLLKHLQFS